MTHISASQIQLELSVVSFIYIALQDGTITSDIGDSYAFCKDMFPLTLEPLWFPEMSINRVAYGHLCL